MQSFAFIRCASHIYQFSKLQDTAQEIHACARTRLSIMILSSFEWNVTMEHIPKVPESRTLNLESEEPALVRLMVALEGENIVEGVADIFVLLILRNVKKYERTGADAAIMGRQHMAYGKHVQEWTEVHRAGVRALNEDTELQYPLEFKRDYELRIQFYKRGPTVGEANIICYVPVELQKLLLEHNASCRYQALDKDDNPIPGYVRVGATSMCSWANRTIFEVRMQFNKKVGWPFSSTRPFFVIYARVANGRWLPVYRSEVLTKRSDHHTAEGTMLFSLADVTNSELRNLNGNRLLRCQDDQCKMRIEFFHYKTNIPSILIGYLETTAIELRQAIKDKELPLHVNSFQDGELVGSMKLLDKIITANTNFYSVMVQFGGELETNFVVFDVNMHCAHRKRLKAFSRPYFLVRRGDEDGPIVHQSDRPRQNRFSGRYEYGSGRISKKKLFGKIDDICRPLSLGLYDRTLRKQYVCIASLVTSVDDILKMDVGTGTRLPLQGDGGACVGYMVVGVTQDYDERIYLKLDFYLDIAEDQVSPREPDPKSTPDEQ